MNINRNINRPFNIWTRYYTYLKKNEIYCNECKGKGGTEEVSEILNRVNFEFVKLVACTKCLGEGKLDWISNVINNKSIAPVTISYRRCKNTAYIPEMTVKEKCTININDYLKQKGEIKNEKINQICKGNF